MRAVVTGCAGFIGSTLVERLLADGADVVGVDDFSDYYSVARKRANMAAARDHDRFHLVEADLAEDDLASVVDGADVVFHQAGQPGVRASWDQFTTYVHDNLTATQRLLDACLGADVARVVYASSSSIYGDAEDFPTLETAVPAPRSPYGVTKLAAEHLCGLYAANFGLSTVSLRYFTVFGPRQRPDMAMHRLIAAALDGTPFPLFGDGSQVRDFTYVDDVVAANLLAAASTTVEPGTVMNISGGGSCSLAWVIETVEELVGAPIHLDRRPSHTGDVQRTGGSTERAAEVLGWQPAVDVAAGLERQVAWQRALHQPMQGAVLSLPRRPASTRQRVQRAG